MTSPEPPARSGPRWWVVLIIGALVAAGAAWTARTYLPYLIHRWRYANLDAPPGLQAALGLESASLRRPFGGPDPTNEQAVPELGTPSFRDYSHWEFYERFAERANSAEGIRLGMQVRDSMLERCAASPAACRERFLLLLGYHDLLPAEARGVGEAEVLQDGPVRIVRRRLVGRLGIPFSVLIAAPTGRQPRGRVIALHGRQTAPEFVMGLAGREDYTRQFGRRWAEAGYWVIAPQVDPYSGLDTRTFGYSQAGQDLAKALDVIAWLRHEAPSSGPLIAAGISYGALLAEAIGIASDEVDAVVSSAGAARADFLYGRMSDSDRYRVEPDRRTTSNENLPPTFWHHFYGIGTFRVLFPKPLVVSSSTFEARESVPLLRDITRLYRDAGLADRLGLNLFIGMHEADPAGEIAAFEALSLPDRAGPRKQGEDHGS